MEFFLPTDAGMEYVNIVTYLKNCVMPGHSKEFIFEPDKIILIELL